MKLDRYLDKHSISRRDFAEAIGVTEVAISRYIGGHRMPRPDQLQRIREATGGAVQPNDFLPSIDGKRRRSA